MASETLSTSLEGHDIITVYLSMASEKLDHSLESHDIVKVWVCLSWLTRHWKLVPRQLRVCLSMVSKNLESHLRGHGIINDRFSW